MASQGAQQCQMCEGGRETVAQWQCSACRIDRGFMCDACELTHRNGPGNTHTVTRLHEPRSDRPSGDSAAPSTEPTPTRANRVSQNFGEALSVTDAAAAADRVANDSIAMPFVPSNDTLPIPDDTLSPSRWRFGDPLIVAYLTWNLAAARASSDGSLAVLAKPCAHIIAVATQENGSYVAGGSAQEEWMRLLTATINGGSTKDQPPVSRPGMDSSKAPPARPSRPQWRVVKEDAMLATHLVVFARDDVFRHIGLIHSDAVKTGFGGGAVGNKGGIGIAFAIAKRVVNPLVDLQDEQPSQAPQSVANPSAVNSEPVTPTPERRPTASAPAVKADRSFISMLFIGSHLSPHQDASSKRNGDYAAIVGGLQVGSLGPYPKIARPRDGAGDPVAAPPARDCTDEFDLVFFGGDLNYRVNGTKYAIEQIISRHKSNRAVLTMNDQLTIARKQGLVLRGFDEGPLFFRPTYKFTKAEGTGLYTDTYDEGPKQRLAAYCDRALYKTHPRYVMPSSLLHYSDVCGVTMTSDHRPVACLVRLDTAEALPEERDDDFDKAVAEVVEIRAGCCARSCVVM